MHVFQKACHNFCLAAFPFQHGLNKGDIKGRVGEEAPDRGTPFIGRSREEEAARFEEAERSLWSSPTQQLVQMAIEAGPLGTARVEPASKIRPKVGGKAPKEFLKRDLIKRALEVPAWDSGSP